MIEDLNILLDAAVELGKPAEIHADKDCVRIDGTTKSGEKFYLRLIVVEGNDAQN